MSLKDVKPAAVGQTNYAYEAAREAMRLGNNGRHILDRLKRCLDRGDKATIIAKWEVDSPGITALVEALMPSAVILANFELPEGDAARAAPISPPDVPA